MMNLWHCILTPARVLVATLAFFIVSGSGVAQAASIGDWAEASDVVVLAQALEWSRDASGKTTVILRVDRPLFENKLAAGTFLTAIYDSETFSTRMRVKAESPIGVWFLKAEPDSWTINAAYGGRHSGFEQLYYPVRANDIESHVGNWSQEDTVLSVARALSESDVHPWRIQEAIGMYDSPAVRAYLAEMTESQDTRRVFIGLAALLKRGDIETLARVKQYQEIIDKNQDPRDFGRIVPRAIHDFYRNTDPRSIDLLGALAHDVSVSDPLREAAAFALSSIHTRATVVHLARLLDANNPAVQRSAVVGLGFFANGVGLQQPSGPTLSHLNARVPNQYTSKETAEYLGFDDTRPAEFIAFWKAWWLENQADFP